MPKSRVRKKKGKPVKYTPKPTGISKTKMKKLMEMIQQYQKTEQENSGETPEIREGEGQLLISPEFIKKLNVNASTDIEGGPELSNDSNTTDPLENLEENSIDEQKIEEDGPSSSNI